MYNALNGTIYLNLDDSVINYSQTIIDILNQKYNLNKTYKDLKDKDFRSIYNKISPDEIKNIITSKLFWDNIKILDSFKNFYSKYKDKYNWRIVEQDLDKRCELRNDFIKSIGIDVVYDYLNDFNADFGFMHTHVKSQNLMNSQAKIKILFKNGYDKPWNKTIYNVDNLYILNNWDDLEVLIKYL